MKPLWLQAAYTEYGSSTLNPGTHPYLQQAGRAASIAGIVQNFILSSFGAIRVACANAIGNCLLDAQKASKKTASLPEGGN